MERKLKPRSILLAVVAIFILSISLSTSGTLLGLGLLIYAGYFQFKDSFGEYRSSGFGTFEKEQFLIDNNLWLKAILGKDDSVGKLAFAAIAMNFIWLAYNELELYYIGIIFPIFLFITLALPVAILWKTGSPQLRRIGLVLAAIYYLFRIFNYY